jgi:deoxyribodipyrimidine photo-lyase
MQPGLRTGLLLHDDDLWPEHLILTGASPVSTAVCMTRDALSSLHVSPQVSEFTSKVMRDSINHFEGKLGETHHVNSVAEIMSWAKHYGLEQIITPYAPVGPNADLLRVLRLTAGAPQVRRITRYFDQCAWPHATAGFFRYRTHIPKILRQIQRDPTLP